jgi:hypothetical protein
LVEREGNAVDCVLLHLLWHVAVLHDGVLSLRLVFATMGLHVVLLVA